MRLATYLLAAAVSLAASSTDAIQLDPLRYDYLVPSNGNYPDSSYLLNTDGTGELLDGIANSIAWGPGITINSTHVTALVGWFGNDPTLRFTFDQPVVINQVVAFIADSNGVAGVGMPSMISLSTPGGFSQSFSVTDPPLAGSTIPVTLEGFSVVTDQITLTATHAYVWTMLSEVQFFNAPEPASGLLLTLAMSTALLGQRRRTQE